MAKWLDNAIFYEIYPQSFLDPMVTVSVIFRVS